MRNWQQKWAREANDILEAAGNEARPSTRGIAHAADPMVVMAWIGGSE